LIVKQRITEIWELTRMQLLGFVREPEAMFWTFGFPIIVSAVMGFAFRRGELPESRIAVLPGPGQAALVEQLGAVPHIKVETDVDPATATRMLQSGKIDALLRPSLDGKNPTVVVDADRSEAETARLRVEFALRDNPENIATIEHPTGNGSRYIDFLFPGLLGINLMATGMWSIGFAIAQMRQKKVLRRLLVTPMRKSSFLASFFFARLAFLAFELFVLIGFGAWILDVPFRANWPAFFALCVLGASAFAGLGLLATARARTIEGASGMLNFIMMPMWLLSGVFFSYERFPEWMQPVIKLLPLTALNDALRKLMLEGIAVVEILPELGILAACGALSFIIAQRVFRWE
jgi:ABC-2 type transport system permease protein